MSGPNEAGECFQWYLSTYKIVDTRLAILRQNEGCGQQIRQDRARLYPYQSYSDNSGLRQDNREQTHPRQVYDLFILHQLCDMVLLVQVR